MKDYKKFKEYKQSMASRIIRYSIVPVIFMVLTITVVYYNLDNPFAYIAVFAVIVICGTNIAPFCQTENFINRIRLMKRLQHDVGFKPIMIYRLNETGHVLNIDEYNLCVWETGNVSLYTPDYRCIMGTVYGGFWDRRNYNKVKRLAHNIVVSNIERS